MKSPLKSKTIIYQVISTMITVALAGLVQPEFKEIIGPEAIIIILLLLRVLDAGVNVVLRFLTKEPLQ